MRAGGPAPARASTARLIALLGSQRWWVLGTAVLAFATLGSGVGLIAMSSYLISRAALVDSTATLALAITGVRFFAVCRAAFRYIERYVGHLATFRVLTTLRVWFFRGIEPLAPARLADHRAGDLLSRILGDIETLQGFALLVAVPAMAAGLVTALVAVTLGSFSLVLGAAVVVYMALVGVALPALSRRMGRVPSEAVAEASAALEAEAVESVAGLAELMAWGREERFGTAIDDLTTRRRELDRRIANLRGITTGVGALLGGLGAMTLFALSVPMVRGGEMDGVFLALVPLVTIAAFEAVTPLAGAMEQLGRARSAGGRLDDLLDAEPAVGDPANPITPDRGVRGLDLEMEDVSFGYGTDPGLALRNVSMHIPAGATAAIIGPSGSGKSTLVSLLLRFWDYPSGSIRLGGVEIAEMTAADTRAQVATVEQHDHLFDTSVRDNMLLADPDADDDRIRSSLAAAGALQFVDALPGGLGARVGEDGTDLSGGERGRLMIARALLSDAPILVLDEATAHLDPPTETQVLNGVRGWDPQRTLVVISHRVAVANMADLVIRMDGGRCRVGFASAEPTDPTPSGG